MSQMTIRNLPPALEERLRSEAMRTSTSLNKTVIQLLKEATGLQAEAGSKRDLSALAGRWTAAEAEEFDRAVEKLAGIDEEIWR